MFKPIVPAYIAINHEIILFVQFTSKHINYSRRKLSATLANSKSYKHKSLPTIVVNLLSYQTVFYPAELLAISTSVTNYLQVLR